MDIKIGITTIIPAKNRVSILVILASILCGPPKIFFGPQNLPCGYQTLFYGSQILDWLPKTWSK
jgi:hypothetical protein